VTVKPDWKWIFGLSIDSELAWGAVRVDAATEGCPYPEPFEAICGKLSDLPVTLSTNNYHEHIAQCLRTLKEAPDTEFLKKVEAIGVSTIGIADHLNDRLMSIARRNLIPGQGKYLVNFAQLFSEIFPDISRIRIQNDATAKCLYRYEAHLAHNPKEPVDLLFLAMFSEGVNGGLVRSARSGSMQWGEPVASLLHQELGHQFPPRHPADFAFDPAYSGCPIHLHCFEALASEVRLRKQWGEDVFQHPEHPAWDIIAHYVAHFCWNMVLAIPPQKIIILTRNASVDFQYRVRAIFGQINNGRSMTGPYVSYPELERPDFISVLPREMPPYLDGVYGALEMARLELIDARRTIFELSDEEKHKRLHQLRNTKRS